MGVDDVRYDDIGAGKAVLLSVGMAVLVAVLLLQAAISSLVRDLRS